ncbi:hypothetical protein BDW69DRAFT_188878 [Aspergillus filifer]
MKNLYHINNPFVSDSHDLQRAYRTAIFRAMCKVDGPAWGQIDVERRHHEKSVEYITGNPKQIGLNASLTAILNALSDIDDVDPEKLKYISNTIHNMTVLPKRHTVTSLNPSNIPPDLHHDADHLISTLQISFKEKKVDTDLAKTILYGVSGTRESFNPLDILLLTFEAPWRGTLYTLLAILQPGPRKGGWVNTLEQEAETYPSPTSLAIAYESLRLYPPVRRISRGHIAIDIEAIQRDKKYWGDDALLFKLERFLSTSGDGGIRTEMIGEGAAWIPFALGGMRCPSSKGLSVRTLVVVGGILRGLARELDGDGDRDGDGDGDWEYSGNREGMNGMNGLDEVRC